MSWVWARAIAVSGSSAVTGATPASFRSRLISASSCFSASSAVTAAGRTPAPRGVADGGSTPQYTGKFASTALPVVPLATISTW